MLYVAYSEVVHSLCDEVKDLPGFLCSDWTILIEIEV